MASKKEVIKFVKSQKSIQFYKKVQDALVDVFLAMPDQDFRKATKNLILMVLHEGALGQVMHFSPSKKRFRVLQLTFPKKIPISVLRYVIAHELGHVMQGRNWKKSDGMKLEKDADKTSENWGFPKTTNINKWIDRHRKAF
ncbi:hypothetical protein KY308_03280 [Candidatus Woesearchaeota archaeon]|nr:hypothetical protein [Candidatus Woesearchaeota archaeon]